MRDAVKNELHLREWVALFLVAGLMASLIGISCCSQMKIDRQFFVESEADAEE